MGCSTNFYSYQQSSNGHHNKPINMLFDINGINLEGSGYDKYSKVGQKEYGGSLTISQLGKNGISLD